MKSEGRIKNGEWKTVTLGDVAEFVRGINFKPDDVVPTGTPGSVACMRTKNVQAELDLSDVWSVGEQFVRREDQFLQAGDVLVSSANSWNLVGKCCWIPELPGRASFGGFVSVLRSHRAKVEPRFLFRWFSSDRIQTTLRSFGQQTTNISNLNIDRCLKLPLPLPPAAKQRRIAEVLDRAEALRAKRRAALAQLDSLTQSLFLDLFGDPATNPKCWPEKSLSEVTEMATGYPFRSEEYVSTADSVRLCRGANILPNRLDWSDLVRWPNSKLAGLVEFNLKPGDVLIAMDRPWISEGFKIARVTTEDCPALLVQRVARLRGRSEMGAEFLFHLLNQPSFTRHCRPTETTIPHISPKDIRSFVFPIPPKELQRKFAGRVKAVETLKVAQRASLAELDALFDSLQHRAFRGEL